MRHGGFDTASYRFVNYAEMSEEDSRKIWQLRNDPAISCWMVSEDPIPFETHRKFVDSLRHRTDKDYFLILNGDSEIIGSVNIDYTESGVSERGLFISPHFHNQGHAYKTMMEFYDKAKRDWGIGTIMTKVKPSNAASNRLEHKLGAEYVENVQGYNIYLLTLE